MKLLPFQAASAEALQAWGRDLAAQLPDTVLLILTGKLGAGKTTLMKGLAEGWGVAQAAEVTSPTYTLIHEYQRGDRWLYHLDLYRIETGAQLETLGLEDLLVEPPAGEKRLVAVEWGEKMAEYWPRPYLQITITEDGEGRRIEPAWIGRTT